MSYILSALKKVEPQRDLPEADWRDWQHLEQELLLRQKRRRRRMLVLVLMLPAILTVLGWWWLQYATSPASPKPATPDHVAPATPIGSVSMLQDQPPAIKSRRKAPASVIWPEIRITGVLLVDDRPSMTRVFLDGQAYKVGEQTPAGVRVDAIAAATVSLSFQGEQRELVVE